MNKNLTCLSSRLRELKNKGNVQLGNTKSGRGRLQFRSQFKRGFTKMVVARAGRLREWSRENFDCSLDCYGCFFADTKFRDMLQK